MRGYMHIYATQTPLLRKYVKAFEECLTFSGDIKNCFINLLSHKTEFIMPEGGLQLTTK